MDSQISPFLKPLFLPVSLPDSLKYSVLCIHVLALLAPWATSLPLVTVIFINIIVLISGFRFQYFNRYKQALADIESIYLDDENQCQIILKNNKVEKAELGVNHYVHHLVTILHVRWSKANWYFIFTKGSLSSRIFRQLRVRLLHPIN